MGLLSFDINSNIVSGLTVCLFNVLLLAVLRLVCQSICTSYNIHIIHDKKRVLTPQQSRLAGLFGGPVGYIPLSRFLAFMLIFYELLAFLLDFSINGTSRIVPISKTYASYVGSHPKHLPLVIDYANEYNVTMRRDNGDHDDQGSGSNDDDDEEDEEGAEGEIVFASQRLVAIAEVQACKQLNFTHHVNHAFAYTSVELLSTRLIPMHSLVGGATCVTEQEGGFVEDVVTHAFAQDKPDIQCNDWDGVTLSLRNRVNVNIRQEEEDRRNVLTSSTERCDLSTMKSDTVCNATLTGIDPSRCNIDFQTVICFHRHALTIPSSTTSTATNSNSNNNNNVTKCAAIGHLRQPTSSNSTTSSSSLSNNDTVLTITLFDHPFNFSSSHFIPSSHILPDITHLSPESYPHYAANVAFLSAIRVKYGFFNSLFMSVAHVQYNISLTHVANRVNVTEVDSKFVAPALAAVACLLMALLCTAFVLRVKFVVRPGRTNFVSFSNINEVFNVEKGTLAATRAGKSSKRYIVLRDSVPVFLNELPEKLKEEKQKQKQKQREKWWKGTGNG